MDISLNRQGNSYQMQPINNQISQAISDNVNKLLLQNVKIGDLFSVEIIDSLQKEIRLMLEDGTIFEATLDKALDLHIGEKATFVVKDIIGKQVKMEMVQPNKSGAEEGEDVDVSHILKELDLPVTKNSQRAVKHLIQDMLPLSKDNIKQLEFALRTSDLSTDSLLSMLENEIPITPTSLSQVEAYEKGEIKLQGQLEKIIDNIIGSDDLDFLEKVHTILTSAKELESSREEEVKPRIQLNKDLPQEPSKKEVSLGKKELLIEELFDKDGNFNKASLSSLHGKNINNIREEIIESFKELLFIDPKNIKNNSGNKLEKIKELYKNIYEITDALEKIDNKNPKDQRLSLYSDVKSNLEFLNISSKYDTIIHIPLIIQDKYKHGELYIFNKQKKNKTSYKEASMLISLDTVSLGTVETYIKKYNRQISTQFKTDNKEIEDFIKSKIDLLKIRLKNKGYDLISSTYISKEDSFIDEKEDKKDIKVERYRFDTKA